jgi:Transposase DDE domain group 1
MSASPQPAGRCQSFGAGARRSFAAIVTRSARESAFIFRITLPRCTRLSCRTFAANAVRLQLHALAYNLGNFLRTLATPEPIKNWSLTSLKEKLIKIGAKVVSHGRYVAFQMAEVAIPRHMFQEILRLIAELRPQPPPAPA